MTASLHGIIEVPEVTVLFRILHFRVRERRFAARAPVDDAAPTVDQSLIIETEERLPHGFGAFFVHRERKARPIAGGSKFF